MKKTKLKYLHFIKGISTEERDDSKNKIKPKSPLRGPWRSNYETEMAHAEICTILTYKHSATTIKNIKYGYVQESGILAVDRQP